MSGFSRGPISMMDESFYCMNPIQCIFSFRFHFAHCNFKFTIWCVANLIQFNQKAAREKKFSVAQLEPKNSSDSNCLFAHSLAFEMIFYLHRHSERFTSRILCCYVN